MWIKFALALLLSSSALAQWGAVEEKVIPKKECARTHLGDTSYHSIWIHVSTPFQWVGIGVDEDNYYVSVKTDYWNDDGFVQLTFLTDEGVWDTHWFLVGSDTWEPKASYWKEKKHRVFCFVSTYDPFPTVPLHYD